MLYGITFLGAIEKIIDAPSQLSVDNFLANRGLLTFVQDCISYGGGLDPDVILEEDGSVVYGDRGMGNSYIDWWVKEMQAVVKTKKNTFSGSLVDGDYLVYLNGSVFDPAPSLTVANHSPDGFSFGYGGSGPAQLALGILLEETGSPKTALEHYQKLKEQFVSHWGEMWLFTSEDVREFLENQCNKK